MATKRFLLLTFLLALSLPFSAWTQYCPIGVTKTVEPITLVTFADINNSSPNTGTPGYQDFSAIVGNLTAGNTYTITLKGNTVGNLKNYFRVYIDWNGNGNFFDPGEIIDIGYIENSNGTDSKTVTKAITVPSCDVAPSVRMRIIKNFNNYDSGPCDYISNGQIEDYTLNISNPGGITDFTVTGGDPDMPNAPVGLSGSEVGITYQLKRNGVNVGSPVPGTGNAINFGNQPAGLYTVEAIRSAGCSKTMSGEVTVAVAVFNYTGADQTYIVPPCAIKVRAHIWGAGGGGGDAIKQYPTLGGGGGYATGDFDVAPNEPLKIVVGQGGTFPPSSPTYGGGGIGGGSLLGPNGSNYTGNGGGRSAIIRMITEVITAGGGGGGGETSGSGDRGGYGGAGGGLVGENGYHQATTTGNRGGKGGSGTTGGAGGTGKNNGVAGTQFQGGNGGYQTGSNNWREGGGGGGGYYGGGGGAADSNQGGGGGGGSSFLGGVVNGNTISGGASDGKAGNESHEYNRSQYGTGGITNGSGKHGRVVIEVIEVDIQPPVITAVTQPNCNNPKGSVILSGLPGGSNGWTITQKPDNTTITGVGTITTIPDLEQGKTYSWSVTNDINCTSDDTPDVTINVVPIPNVPTINSTNASCSSASTHTITNYSTAETYTSSPAGLSVDGNGVISGGVEGQTYSITAKIGSCTSTASTNFTFNAQFTTPATPTISSIAASCTAPGTSKVTNNDPALTYVFSPTGPVVQGDGSILGMTFGTNYTVAAANANCTSTVTNSFKNEAQYPTPNTPTITTTNNSCSSDGTAKISNYDSNLSYTFAPTGPTISSTGEITITNYGTDYTVKATNTNSCDSDASTTFTIKEKFATPATPSLTVNAADCTNDGNASISNHDGNLTYIFNPSGPSTDASGNITNLSFGTNYTVAAANVNCTSSVTNSFSIDEKHTTPNEPTISITAANCQEDGKATITNYQTGVNYIFTPTGPTVLTSGEITGMNYATSYTVKATNSALCESTSSSSFTIDEKLNTPTKPTLTITLASCDDDGNGFIANHDANNSYIFSPAGPTIGSNGEIENVQFGTTYTVIAKDNTSECTSENSESFIIDKKQDIPATPEISILGATCSANGMAFITNYTNGITYDFTPNGPQVDASGNILDLTPGIDYTITAMAGTCPSEISDAFQIEEMLPTPTVTVSSDQTVCAGTSVTLTANGASTYAWAPSDVISTGNTAIASPSSTTTYTVTGTNDDGCSNSATVTITVKPIPTAGITIEEDTGFGPHTTTIKNTSSNANSYGWNFGNGQLDNSNTPSFEITYEETDVYTVTLIVSNGICSDTATATVTVLDFPVLQIEAPNVFTPNGDGQNDVFFIQTENASSVQVEIFNRWGNLIYTLENDTDSWDGKDATDGVYFYKYRIKDLKDEETEGHGFFHLLR